MCWCKSKSRGGHTQYLLRQHEKQGSPNFFVLRIFILEGKDEVLQAYNSAGHWVVKLEYSLKLKIKRNDWLHADTCPQAANHCALFELENELKFYNPDAGKVCSTSGSLWITKISLRTYATKYFSC